MRETTSDNDRVIRRDSNIELLRIVLMIMIVLHHLVYHGGLFANSTDRISTLILYGIILPGGKIGFDCFIIISAWFSTDSEFKGSKFIKTALQIVFYNFLLMGLSALFGHGGGIPAK